MRQEKTPIFEAKRISKRLTAADRDQAISYAKPLGILFVVVTNGTEMHCYNVTNKRPISWNSKLISKIPTKTQLGYVTRALKTDINAVDVSLSSDTSLPFRPGLALRQLNGLFSRIHSTIRKIEKDEEHAFSDFSKLLFLKLLEEKSDTDPSFTLPYSYRFHELAAKPPSEADQVRDAIERMRDAIINRTPYGDVLEDLIHLRNAKTFATIVSELSAVSFSDSGLDSKGAAFEYFVRATLKGKKLGQYFTPRNLVMVMAHLVGREKLVNQLLGGSELKVLDPACGTGGFLVFLMQDGLKLFQDKLQSRTINQTTFDRMSKQLMTQVFFGSDANPGVACSAKMNMIVAGDGHTNIQCEDSLSRGALNWSSTTPSCHFIFTNPPFGTSESESLDSGDLAAFPIRSTKGQHLFIQKMVLSTLPRGEICTVIDEGVLNTDSAKELRRWILQTCRLRAVVRLPDETFKPNKINVKSSVLFLERLEEPDEEGELDYPVTFIDLESLGYEGSGDAIRGFDFAPLLEDIQSQWLNHRAGQFRKGPYWNAFDISVTELRSDASYRFDLKYWEPGLRTTIANLISGGAKTIRDLNTLKTERGTSPPADLYVDDGDGYALVIKAGSNISRFGELITKNADWIEKNIYDEFVVKATADSRNLCLVREGDVLVSSTGDGTLGKSCVFRGSMPAIADGHVAIIRVNQEEIWPEFLADYLRCGIGAAQIVRLYTGSTGLIELTPDALDSVVVDLLSGVAEQKLASKKIRKAESDYQTQLKKIEANLANASAAFRSGAT